MRDVLRLKVQMRGTALKFGGLVAMGLLCSCSSGASAGVGAVGFFENSLYASFARAADPAKPLAKSVWGDGGCSLWPSYSEVPAPTEQLLGAGILSVSTEDESFTVYPQTNPLDPGVRDFDQYYTFRSPDEQPFAPGERVEFSFSGEVVPQFAGTILMPAPITWLQPELVDPSSLDATAALSIIDRAADLHVTWTGGESTALATFSLSDKNSRSIGCSFPASGGSALVPASLLTQLAPSEQLDDSKISIGTLVERNATAADWSIRTYAKSGARESHVQIR